MRVELLMFPDCPHVAAARAQLQRALDILGLAHTWTERDITAPDVLSDLAAMGSPTILVNGVDVAPAPDRAGITCRLYPGTDVVGAPPLAAVLAALRLAMGAPSP